MNCKTKRNGGLGLRHLRLQNQAYMTKLGWNLIQKRDDLWVRVLRSKYKCGADLIPKIDKEKVGSNTWSGIKAAWKYVEGGYVLGHSGRNVSWKHDRHREFTIKSAYNVIANDQGDSDAIWSRIWKLNTAQRCRNFIWLAMHNKLLTNEVRLRRRMCEEDRCEWCKNGTETLIHVLRDCSETRSLWLGEAEVRRNNRFFDLNLRDWIRTNMSHSGWGELFSTICWAIWRRRNERIFEGKNSDNENLRISARSIIACLTNVRKKLRGVNLNGNPVVDKNQRWYPPPSDRVKMNVDGAFSAGKGIGCGGLIRDAEGHFISGFMHHSSEGDSFTAELWALMLGLKTAWDGGYRKVCIETDAQEVVKLVQGNEGSSHPDGEILGEVKVMLNREWDVELNYIPRNANCAADLMAKQALTIMPGYHPVLRPSEELEGIISQDASGLADIG